MRWTLPLAVSTRAHLRLDRSADLSAKLERVGPGGRGDMHGVDVNGATVVHVAAEAVETGGGRHGRMNG